MRIMVKGRAYLCIKRDYLPIPAGAVTRITFENT